jgi:thiamine-phosphate pyrophosphorylase
VIEKMDAAISRILDANFNRAREAARVAEDFARFVLNDGVLAGEAKGFRHSLVGIFDDHNLAAVLHSRATEQDVGRTIQTDSEYRRNSPAMVAKAATKRLAEALRTIEEYGKTANPTFAARIEELRYQCYGFEQRLLGRIEAADTFAGVRLYVIITETLCRGHWLTTARAALAGGADCLQLREKNLADAELLLRARQIVAACREHGAKCIINDRPDIAALAEADGVHVGQDDLPAGQVRTIVGAHRIIGLSTHTADQAEAAIAARPDYVAVGPMFPSATKTNPHLAGPATLLAASRRVTVPLVGIGGIDCGNAAEVLQAGAAAVCVCSAVIAQPDPAEAARSLRSLIDSAMEARAQRPPAGSAHHETTHAS